MKSLPECSSVGGMAVAAVRPSWFATPWITALLSVLLSIWCIVTTDSINNDGILYLNVATRLAAGDWSGAHELYRWLFFPGLIAVLATATGLSLETAAHTLDTALAALMAYAFVQLVRDLGGARRVCWLAALVVLGHPYLNDLRAEIIRDHGYWAFYLLALRAFLAYYRQPCWAEALRWGGAMTLATLFRVEGVVILLLLPLVLGWRPGTWRTRWRLFGQAQTIVGIWLLLLLIGLLTPGFPVDYLGRLHDVLKLASAFGTALGSGLAAQADRLSEAVLNRYADDYALAGIVILLLLMLADKLVHTVTPFYAVLFGVRRLRCRLSLSAGSVPVLLWLAVLNLGISTVFLVVQFFISSRHLIPLALLALLLSPFLLATAWGHWQQRWQRGLLIVVLVGMSADGLITLPSASQAYIREAATWLHAHVQPPVRLYTNNQKLFYYSGLPMSYDAYADWRNTPRWHLDLVQLQQLPWQDYDYVVLWLGRGDLPQREQLPTLLGREPIQSFSNGRGEAVLIFKTHEQP